MIFSQRYRRALAEQRLAVELTEDVRRKLWAQLERFDRDFYIQRDQSDNWKERTTALKEVGLDLLVEHGWTDLPAGEHGGPYSDLRSFFLVSDGPIIFDICEMMFGYLDQSDEHGLRVKINDIMDVHVCPWRCADREFFKLDSDFVGARLVDSAHDALAKNGFAGAAHEFAHARMDLATGDTKDAIFYATKSFESTLKVLTGLSHANADRMIKAFVANGHIDDLPEEVRASFGEQVLKTLPALRNKLAGHGQGANVVEVAHAYAELAIQLAAAFQNFLIAKHLERSPTEPAPPATVDWTSDPAIDEVPF